MDCIAAAQFRIEPREGRTTRELADEICGRVIRVLEAGLPTCGDATSETESGKTLTMLKLETEPQVVDGLVRVTDAAELERVSTMLEMYVSQALEAAGKQNCYEAERNGEIVNVRYEYPSRDPESECTVAVQIVRYGESFSLHVFY